MNIERKSTETDTETETEGHVVGPRGINEAGDDTEGNMPVRIRGISDGGAEDIDDAGAHRFRGGLTEAGDEDSKADEDVEGNRIKRG